MNVALVHLRHRETGGTERYLNQVAAHLAEHGHAVTVVCRSHERPPHPGVRFVVLRSLCVGATWRMWAFAQAVERHVRLVPYDIVFGLGRTWSQDVIRLGGGCEQTYLDLAHPHTLRPWERIIGHGRLRHRLSMAIERRALRPGAYTRVITNSAMVKRDVISRYAVPEEKVAIIYNGVDLERFHPRQRDDRGAELRRACGFRAGDFVVLFLGTGYGRKGLQRILRVFPALVRERSGARLLVVGYDSSQPAFERQAADLGIHSQVRFLGGRRDAEACFGAADVYVLPTYYDPFANSTLEALASGLPVITTATNGASELLTHHVEGSILPRDAGNEALLRELLVWADHERTRDGGQAARRLAERHPQEETARASTEVLEGAWVEKHAGR